MEEHDDEQPLLGGQGGGGGGGDDGSRSVAQKVADRLAGIVAPDRASLFWREALLYALIVAGTVGWWAWATTGIGAEFLASFAGAMGTVLALQWANNVGFACLGRDGGEAGAADREPVWGLSLAFFVGSLAKVFAVTVNILTYLALRLTLFDMANPHDERPLTVGEVMLRATVVAFGFVALTEEVIKLQCLLTFDDSDSRLGQSLNIYHPVGVVLVSVALSLGSCGWAIVPAVFQADHSLPWAYTYWSALMEVPLHLATGALVGVGVARRMFLREAQPSWRVLLVPVLLRGVFFMVYMLPFRNSEAPPDPFLDDSKSIDDASMGADRTVEQTALDEFEQEIESVSIDIGEWLMLCYLFNLVLVTLGTYYAVTRVEELVEDASDQGSLTKARGDGDL